VPAKRAIASFWRTMKPSRILRRGFILASFVESLSLISSGVLLIMNVATAAPEQLVSYNSTRVDSLEIFYREAGPKDAHDSSSPWVAIILPDVSIAAGI